MKKEIEKKPQNLVKFSEFRGCLWGEGKKSKSFLEYVMISKQH